jgi:hypothetical protein
MGLRPPMHLVASALLGRPYPESPERRGSRLGLEPSRLWCRAACTRSWRANRAEEFGRGRCGMCTGRRSLKGSYTPHPHSWACPGRAAAALNLDAVGAACRVLWGHGGVGRRSVAAPRRPLISEGALVWCTARRIAQVP